jgi:hypothetical protein
MVPRTLGEDGSNEIDYYNWIGWGNTLRESNLMDKINLVSNML